MPKKVKLAILRARYDKSIINDQACIDMLMTSPARRSILNYWSDNTYGYLDFQDSTMFPWVDVTYSLTDRNNNGVISRQTQILKAYEATKAINNNQDLVGFDGFIIITLPGDNLTIQNPLAGQPAQPATITIGFDAGACSVFGKPACALPVMTSNHTFMCHEAGHVLGFGHTYGVWNNGIDWDGISPFDQGQVYGDPYDIMSSAAFGSRWLDPAVTHYHSNPTFKGAVIAGWPNSNAFSILGPAPARAHVHQWDPLAFSSISVYHMQTPNGGIRNIRLYAAGTHRGSPRLIVIHPANEDKEGRGLLCRIS